MPEWWNQQARARARDLPVDGVLSKVGRWGFPTVGASHHRPCGMSDGRMPPAVRAVLASGRAVPYSVLLRSGATDADVRRWTRQGALERPRRGYYARVENRAPDDLAELVSQLRGAVAAGPDVVASHRTAARLWGLPVWGQAPAPEVTRAYGTAGIPGVTVHRYGVLDPAPHERFGVPVTSPARTLVDVCRVTPPSAALATVDAGIRDLDVCIADALGVLASLGDINFKHRTRQVLSWADPLSENAFESFSRGQLLLEGVPAPLLQWWVGDGNYEWFRPDKLWPTLGLIGEADGRAKYRVDVPADGRDPLVREKGRQEWFEDRDFEFVRFSPSRIARNPTQVAMRWRTLAARQRSRPWRWPVGVWLVAPGPWPPNRSAYSDESAAWRSPLGDSTPVAIPTPGMSDFG